MKSIRHPPIRLELARLAGSGLEGTDWPPLPPPGPDGNYPALEYARISLARKIIRDRKRLGLSQSELARQAGIPAESLNRLEHGKTNATLKTIEKIDRALRVAERTGKKPKIRRA